MKFDNTKPNGNRGSRISENASIHTHLGKIPPQACELEQAVLSAIMNEQYAILSVVEFLKPEMFYKEAHQLIYQAIVKLFTDNNPVDLMAVLNQLRSQGELEIVGGHFALADISEVFGSSSNIVYNSKIVQQKFIQRELIRISVETLNSAYEDTVDVLELVSKNQSQVFELVSNQQGKKIRRINELVAKRKEDYRIPAVDGLTGIGSGLKNIDNITSGWQKNDLIIVGARPAMGKTAFVLAMAKNAAILHNTPVAIFELEMSEDQLTDRLISSETNIFQDKLIRKTLTEKDFEILDEKLVKLNDAPIFIDDTPGITLLQLRSKLIRLKQLYNIGMAVVDYLQLMSPEPGSRETRDQQIGKISRGLKILAKELGIPIIALSQLSRAVDDRPGTDKRPRLSDLRESGSLEQDADAVLFLYRPEYYHIQPKPGETNIGLCEVIFAKHRNGVCDTALLDFHGGFMRFKDWGPADQPLPPIEPHLQGVIGFEELKVKNSSLNGDDDDAPF
jgi:replicative DNA helicase